MHAYICVILLGLRQKSRAAAVFVFLAAFEYTVCLTSTLERVLIFSYECRYRIVGGIGRQEDGSVDYSEDFFGQKAFLTVSGQIQGEYYACALSNIYTFGPTFRAENSHTSRHLAEFWMIEPEMAFCELQETTCSVQKTMSASVVKAYSGPVGAYPAKP